MWIIYIIEYIVDDNHELYSISKDTKEIHDQMKIIFNTPVRIFFKSVCYHNEEKKFKYNMNKETTYRKQTVEEVTFRENKEFKYFSWMDGSGIMNLNSNKKYIRLRINAHSKFADKISEFDYDNAKRETYFKNKEKDTNFRFSEEKEMDIKTLLIVRVGDSMCCMGIFYYWLSVILGYAELYKLYFNSSCSNQKYNIIKLISTRYSLDPNSDKLKKYIPQIVIGNNATKYDEKHEKPENKRDAPSETELKEAMNFTQFKYEKNITNTRQIQRNIELNENEDYNRI